jgi:hypothetical protein
MDRKNGKLMTNKKFEVIAHEVVEHLYIIEAEDMDEAIDLIQEEDYEPVHKESIMKMIDEVKEISYV